MIGLDVIGAMQVIGAFDIGAAQLKLNALKPVTVGVARAMISYAQKVMLAANTVAKQRSLPGQTTRDNVVGHLQWHADALGKLTDNNALYASGDDAKKYTMMAWIESNAVEEGAAYMDEAWSQMWDEIGQRLASLPKDALQKLEDIAAPVVTAAKWTYWIVVAAVVGIAGLIGYGAYRKVSGR
jgi:hypothetical protein